jgi:ketohexokinase
MQQGRIPDTVQSCIRLLRNVLPNANISVEIEKPGREGLPELASEVDVVFYSRSWAEVRLRP